MTKKEFSVALSQRSKLDSCEKEIEDALPEAIEDLAITANVEAEQAIARKAAENYFRKDAKINIRLSSQDVEGIKRLAAREGLPYQTLISRILHKYVANNLVSNNSYDNKDS